MKQKSTFLKVFMTLMLLCGVSSMWADTVTMAYTSSETTNMTGENDAKTVGLDGDSWSVVAYKGGNNNYPGLNKAGQIRLYGAESNHNSITVRATDNQTINSIKVTYGSENYNAIVTVNNETVTGTGGNDDEKTYAINGSSFSIAHNYTSTTQVYILSIEITYTSSTPSKTLISLAVSGTPTKTQYKEGEEFDPSGLTVTGTYDDGPDEITKGIVWSVTPKTLSLETKSVSVTATVGEIKSTPYNVNVTVTEKPVLPSYTLVTDASTLMDGDVIVLGAVKDDNWYVNGGHSDSNKYLDSKKATYNNGILESNEAVEITLKKTTDGWYLKIGKEYINTTIEKALTFGDEALTAWTISIDGDNNATVSAGDYGRFLYNAQYPRFLNYTSATSVSMLLPQIFKKKDTQTQTVTISSVGYSTYSSTFNLVVPADETVYGAKVKNENSVELIPVEEGTIIKAGEGFIVKGTANATVTFTVSSEDGEAISGNELLGTGNGTLDLNAGDAYLLGAKDGKAVFALCNAGTLGANKACLPAPAGANSTLGFDDATGIEFELQDAKSNVVRYNLNGQVVGNDYKGIVIVNGKKFLNK